MRKLYRSRTFLCIPAIVIALLLVAGAVAFTHQLTSAHAQASSQHAVSKQHSTGGCSSVDGISNNNVNAALAQCGYTGNLFKATVVDSNMTATRSSIRAWMQQNARMAFANQCNYFACSTAQFPANVGDVVCYQATVGTTQTDVECYTISSSSNTTPVLKAK